MGNSARQVFIVELVAPETLDVEIPARALVSEKIHITLESKSGQRARLRIEADRSVTIGRKPSSKRAVPV